MFAKDRFYFQLPPFLREFRDGHAVLVYHKLGFPKLRDANKGLYISPKLFEKQLAELKAAGFSSSPLDALAVLGNTVAITFDDGYVSTFNHAMGPLREHGFKAIQFISSAYLGKESAWDKLSSPLMDKAQVRDWLQAGHLIGSHTVTHASLVRLNEAQAREEITASRKFLEDEFGVEIQHFCYPFGDWNQRIAGWVAEAGYLTASTSESGINADSADPFALRRIHAYVPLRSLQGLYYFLNR